MSPTPCQARRAGWLYLLTGVPAAIDLYVLPRTYLVPGNASATAANVLASMLAYRVGVLCGLVSSVAFLALVATLYAIFEDVDRPQARLMVLLVIVSVALGTVNLLNQLTPLVLLSGTDRLAALSRPQLDALAYAFLRVSNAGDHLNMAFWGLWLLPFGRLVQRSGFVPSRLGVALMIGGAAYVAVAVVFIVLPVYLRAVNQLALPIYAVGETWMTIWLLTRRDGAEGGAPVGPIVPSRGR